jgi:PAS domain S-box-containing protein
MVYDGLKKGEMEKAGVFADPGGYTMLAFLPYPVLILDMIQTVVSLNPAFERVFGWTLEELSGKKIPFVPDKELGHSRKGMNQLFKEKVLHGFETRRLTKSGRILEVLIDAAVFFDDRGNPAGQIVCYRDVRGLNRTKEMVIHHLSHELKTPISVLYASLGLLERHLPCRPSPSWERIMARARRNLKRLLDLQYEIGDMLRKDKFY